MGAPEYICSQVDFPICKALSIEPTKYASAEKSLGGAEFRSPYTLALLLVTTLCAVRMITHINSLYASIGRGEMRTFFGLYIFANVLQLLLIGFENYLLGPLYMFITIIQTSLQSTMYFALFTAGITIDRIYGIFSMKSSVFMIVLTSIYLMIISSFVFMCCTIGNEYVIIITFSINIMSLIFYIFLQISKLKRTNSEIWSYGILAIIFLFCALATAHMFTGADLIALLTERNLDNLFFINLYSFIMIMMVHKYWLSTCDFELECLALHV